MKKLKYIVDIDNTICKEEGDVITRIPYLDRIAIINELYNQGHYIIYHTARGLRSGRGEAYYRPITEKQLNDWGCLYHELTFKQNDCDIFIDDKAINSEDFFKK
jgi:hypothetical protein